MGNPLLVTFIGGSVGSWQVQRVVAIRGEPLPAAERLAVLEGREPPPRRAAWALRGVVSHERYVTRGEHDALRAVQAPLGRPSATRAALIPVRKSDAWWELPQDERRAIFAERSGHVRLGLRYLPAIARRLHHCRDLGEPFDFLTWFEYAPEHEATFDELVGLLRESEEWRYVEREVDVRLSR